MHNERSHIQSAQESRVSRGHGYSTRRLRRPAINITGAERLGRIVLGSVAMFVAVVLLIAAGSAWAVVLELALLAAGADLVITGALGHCPLYHRLGYVPRSLRIPS